MGMFTRLADIINANINSMLDKAEDPEKLVRLLVQEMEETLVDIRAEAARHIADKKTLSRKTRKLTQQSSDWLAKAEVAIAKGRDDLAKAALTEKAKLDEHISVVEEDLEKVESTLASLQDDVTRLQSKLAEAKARQQSFAKRHQAASVRLQAREVVERLDVDKAFERFESVERKIDDIEAKVEAYDFAPTSDLDAQFKALENEGKIDAELAALKSKVKPAQQPAA